MRVASKDDFLKLVEYRLVTVPELGECRIKSLGAHELLTAIDQPDNLDKALYLLASSLVDEKGEKLFQNPSELKQLPLSVFAPLSKAVNELNGIGQEPAVKKKSKAP